MKTTSKSPRIAGEKTFDQWQAFRKGLVVGGDQAVWGEAAADYFHKRLSWRYLEPIRVLQRDGKLPGEGFSIVPIQVTLIAFLSATFEGLN